MDSAKDFLINAVFYLKEWEESCVDETLTRLNVTAAAGDRPYEYLFYADSLPRRNDGRIGGALLKKYQHLESGGWWCSGIDILTGEEDLWGCFKPDSPRCGKNKAKPIKYEHPPQTTTGIFALRVPLHLWQKISDRYQQPILPEEINPDLPDLGFWSWFLKYPHLPLCITEGAKKAGALLTAGYVAIALPGIYGGYRIPRDQWGKRIGFPHLIPQLQKLVEGGHPVYFAFDRDPKPKTIKAVNHAIKQTGHLLTRQKCEVKVITWHHHLGKGVDDLIANQGVEAFDIAYTKAPSLELWQAQTLTQLTYPASTALNQRYLPKLTIPEQARLIAIKSPKGTGKTQFLETVVKAAIKQQKRILVLGHRVKLVEELCQRFGLNYITQRGVNGEGETLGYGLCIDSLHPNSQAQFNPEHWRDSVVIIDEVEQVLWHGLNSTTCSGQRVAILKALKMLMQNVLGGEGQVYVADADLSDVSLDYLLTLGGVPLTPFVITNDWQPTEAEAWRVYAYDDPSPDRLLQNLEQHLREGGKPFVCLSAQKIKSKWGTSNLELYFRQKFPHLKILRLDAESLAEPNHPTEHGLVNLNQILVNYDLVLASPVIETGVSIELKDHFTSVWAIAQGIQGENSVRQALGRIRANIPRHVWIAPWGFNQVGNGATSITGLLDSGQRLTQLNIKLLQQADFAGLDDLEIGFQAESLLCWAKLAVRFNSAMLNYRETVLGYLQSEGHSIETVGNIGVQVEAKTGEEVNKEETLEGMIAEVRDRNYQGECEAIAQALPLTEFTYQTLKKCLVKTSQQRQQLRKYELEKRYGLKVTPALVQRDDRGWYPQLRLHYFSTVGRPYLAERDALMAKQLIARGDGDIFAPDFNRSQLGVAIGIIEKLGISSLLEQPERELRNTDADLIAVGKLAVQNRALIKTVLGIGLAHNSSIITTIRRFLELMGYGLKSVKYERNGARRLHVYQMVIPADERWEVFENWLRGERVIIDPLDDLFPAPQPVVNNLLDQGKYRQLSLSF